MHERAHLETLLNALDATPCALRRDALRRLDDPRQARPYRLADCGRDERVAPEPRPAADYR
jgi:hypothetical protein